MNNLFFELVRVAIARQDELSRVPTTKEWRSLYDMAERQTLIGICFAGVQRLRKRESPGVSNLPQDLFMKWLGVVARIQQRNGYMDKCCTDVQKLFESRNLHCLILKGQGIAKLYDAPLGDLRQSGDIDLWAIPYQNENKEDHFKNVMDVVESVASIKDFNMQHVAIQLFGNVEIEVHFMPSMMQNPFHNKRLQKWLKRKVQNRGSVRSSNIPSIEFNIVYILQHCYNHLLFEGVGLRQIMDYYYVLKNSDFDTQKKREIYRTLQYLGLYRFASAMMWVMLNLFRLEQDRMICHPNEKEGLFLLKEIMNGGNFGQYGNDEIMKQHGRGIWAFFKARMKRNTRFLRRYPSEIFWSPIMMLMHKYWKNKISNNISKTI